MMRRLIKVLLLFLFLFTTPATTFAQDTGPTFETYFPIVYSPFIDQSSPWIGPIGGPVVVIQTHPSNSNIVYAGTWGAGVFMSTDAGNTWISKRKGLNNLYINSMAIDPINPRILYAGTYQDKLYKSTDGGQNWFQSSSGIQKDAIVYAITIDPNNADILFISTRGENTTGAPPWKGVVYRSTNEGIDWSPVLQNVPRLGVNTQDWAYDLIVNPKNSAIVFAAFHEAGIYRSNNRGDTWAVANTGIVGDNSVISARGLSINPKDFPGNALYMGTWHRLGTYKSIDNAQSWTNTPLDVKVYNMDLDNVSPNVLYLANFDPGNFKGGIYKSSNSGTSWSLVGLGNEIMYTVAVNQTNHSQVFAGTLTDGIFRSDNSGSNWSLSSQGLFNTNVSGMLAIPGDQTTLIGATANNGVSISQNKGITWSQMNNGLSDKVTKDLVLNPADPNQIFVLTASGGLYKCTLPDCTWRTANSGLPTASMNPQLQIPEYMDENQKREFILAGVEPFNDSFINATNYKSLNQLVFSQSNNNIAYMAIADSGVRKSSDNGSNWSPAGLSGKTVNSLAVDPLNENIIYAATNDIGVINYSTNAGQTWLSTTIAGGKTNSLSTTPVNSALVYAGTDNGVYVRTGNGTWDFLGLGGIKINEIAAHPGRSGVLVAGTNQGAFYSINNGLDWVSISPEISNLIIRSVQFDPNHSNRVYLGTSTAGTFRFYLP